ncbi:MAG: DapH/DapD/GlmU-related protein [ANME-2 cluster archaeon]|nr:DapH/DapD/GlmU-related protein [ANME-2 cluster archaeon]
MTDHFVDRTARLYGINSIGKDCMVLEDVTLGHPSAKILQEISKLKISISEYEFNGVTIGSNAMIRSGSIIYSDVKIGDNFRTGHTILIRENTTIGNDVLVGTNVIIDGNTTIGSNVSIQGNAYIPTNTLIEDNVFIGPCAVLANDKYPIRKKYGLKGPILRRGASIGANCTILPGIEVGEGAMVAAGAIVTKDVPKWKLAVGSPAKIVELPPDLKTVNNI